MAVQQTLVLVKPDAVERGLIGEVVSRIERRGYRVREMRLRHIGRELAEQHYAEHTDKPFFEELVSFITSGPLVAMRVEGDQAIPGMRQIMGATDPLEAAPGSIRGELATDVGRNLVHGSDSPESAERELELFFG